MLGCTILKSQAVGFTFFYFLLQGSIMQEVKQLQVSPMMEHTLSLQVRILMSMSGTIEVRMDLRPNQKITGRLSVFSPTKLRQLFLGAVSLVGVALVYQEHLYLLIFLYQSNHDSRQPIPCHRAMVFSQTVSPRDPQPGLRRSFLYTHWFYHPQNVNCSTSS